MNDYKVFEILTDLRGVWGATPWDYSSSRWLHFKKDGNSDCCYGYGQTIYAVINFDFEVLSENTIKLIYLDSPAVGHRFKGFSPSATNAVREINFKLKQEEFAGRSSITGREFKYHWNLTLSDSLYPEGFQLPYEIPLIYYGHRDC